MWERKYFCVLLAFMKTTSYLKVFYKRKKRSNKSQNVFTLIIRMSEIYFGIKTVSTTCITPFFW